MPGSVQQPPGSDSLSRLRLEVSPRGGRRRRFPLVVSTRSRRFICPPYLSFSTGMLANPLSHHEAAFQRIRLGVDELGRERRVLRGVVAHHGPVARVVDATSETGDVRHGAGVQMKAHSVRVVVAWWLVPRSQAGM